MHKQEVRRAPLRAPYPHVVLFGQLLPLCYPRAGPPRWFGAAQTGLVRDQRHRIQMNVPSISRERLIGRGRLAWGA